MRTHLFVAAIASLLAATQSPAQTTGPAASEKPETSCSTISLSAPASGTTKSADTSMAIEKSAILPSAGGYSNSAAPTVQSDGKAMEVRPECPPESKK